MVLCPECENDLDIEEDEMDEGETIECPECGTNFEVISVHPLDLRQIADGDEDAEASEGEEGEY